MGKQWMPKAERMLTSKEMKLVLDDLRRRGLRSINSRMNLAIFRLASCAGLRVSEIIQLRMDDVRTGVQKRHIRIRPAIAKGKRGRTVPLTWDADTLADVIAWKAERAAQGAGRRDLLICAQSKTAFGKPLDRIAAGKRFKAACRCLGPERLTHLCIHDGRHGFISHALARGVNVVDVRDAAGHSSIATTNQYAHAVDTGDQVGNLFAF